MTAIPSQATQSQSFSLRSTVQSIADTWISLKKSVTNSEVYSQAQQYKKTIHTQFCTPVGNVWRQTYSQFPSELTKFKFSYLNQFSQKERMVALNIVALGGCLFTFRKLNAGQIFINSFRAVKNSAIIYILGGLIIAPQIYNPLMKRE